MASHEGPGGDERAHERADVIRRLRADEERWERERARLSSDNDLLLPTSERDAYNQALTELRQAGEDIPEWLYSTGTIVPRDKTQTRPYDGVPLGSLLAKVSVVLRTL
jgi:hypothetical protein